jgi:hypothetical protein
MASDTTELGHVYRLAFATLGESLRYLEVELTTKQRLAEIRIVDATVFHPYACNTDLS